MAAITLSKLNKHYGSLHHAVKDVDLAIADKEFVALVGPSGCGKSTTLRMIAGLEDISSGEIRIGDKVVNNLAPRDRDVAMVFQNYALYQHMSVYDNLALGSATSASPRPRSRVRSTVPPTCLACTTCCSASRDNCQVASSSVLHSAAASSAILKCSYSTSPCRI